DLWALIRDSRRRVIKDFQAIHYHPLLPHPLFPSVQDVWIIFIPALLLSTSVKSVTVVTDSVYSDSDVRLSIPPDEVTGQEWVSVANRVADIAPQLSSFTIVMEQHQEQDVINHWAGKVPALSEAFDLRTLQLSLFDFQYDEVNNLHPLRLPTLENLSLDTNSLSLSTCSAFVQTLHVNRLKSLTLSCFFNADTDPALSSLRFRPPMDKPIWDELDESRFILTPFTAHSLVPFKRFESLSIGPCNPLELADHDLQTMLGSWPRLKYQAPLLTLSGVHGALQSVPLLERLALYFDRSTFTPASDSLTFPHQNLAIWIYPSFVTIEYFKAYLEGLRRAHAAWPFEADVVLQAKAFINQFTETAVMVDRWASVRGYLLAKE
ncbi:hypothetical protein BKA70DRAFT_1360560, partial [Coprinopsis sp. MPI-PUGE-AT-0042]